MIDKKNNINNIEEIQSLQYINYFLENQFNELKEELDINLETIHFIDTYYFNKLDNILIELLKIFPEFIIFKQYTTNNLRRYIFLNLLNINTKLNYYIEKKGNIIFEYRKIYDILVDIFGGINNRAIKVKFTAL